MTTSNPYRGVTSLKYLLFAVLTCGTGVALIYLSGLMWFKNHESLGNLCNQLGGLLIASVALATLWELAGRRSFVQETLQLLGVAHDVHSAGLEAVGVDYTRVIDWDVELDTVRQLDVFAAWATTWRNSHLTKLTDLAARNGSQIRVVLPDRSDSALVSQFASRFNMTSASVQSKLDEAIDGYKNLDNGTGMGRVEIYISPVFRTFTAYRLDDHFIITLYQHKDHRSGRIPVFKFRRGGSVFNFFEEDLEAVLNASTRIYP